MESDLGIPQPIDFLDGQTQVKPTTGMDRDFQLALSLHRQGKLELAKEIYANILDQDPEHAQVWHLSGVLALQWNDAQLAAKLFARAISLEPQNAAMHFNQGLAHEHLQLPQDAIASYTKAIDLQPNDYKSYINRGSALKAIGKLQEAISDYEQAIALNPASAEAYSNRGNVLASLRKWKEALESFNTAIALKPTYVQAYINRATTFLGMHRLEEAIADYEVAISHDKNNALAHWNLAHTLLLKGDYPRGWALYEWRWAYGDRAKYRRQFTAPFWHGQESIAGKYILLHHEQGLGDTIQFVRYVKLVKKLGAKVILEVPQSLIGLLKKTECVDQIIPTGDDLPDYDYHCPIISLPLAFNTETDSIPYANGYLSADDAKVRYWKQRIARPNRLKVGVVWSGGLPPNQPDLRASNERRNIPLNVFAKALNTVDADFYSLQKGDPAESEIRNREHEFWPRGNFFNYASELYDFSDTAGLIENMDLVVSVDTSTAHLAAAIGKTTWVLNRHDTCWRWMIGREDSPWYHCVQLFRQEEDGQWESVICKLAKELAKLEMYEK